MLCQGALTAVMPRSSQFSQSFLNRAAGCSFVTKGRPYGRSGRKGMFLALPLG